MSKARYISRQMLFSLLCLSTTLQGMPAYALDANALPEGGVVVSGNANFDYSAPNELHVHQDSDKAVINWNSFNIGESATTQFHQNSSNSIAVNRVVGKGIDPTQIMGTLKANGKIVVLDRNGVIFGQNSQVDVGGIIASTGNIDDAAFMNNGRLNIVDADTGGAIINNGTITVREAGLAAFVSPTVKNNGVINARLGQVTLAAGDEATVDLYGDGLVELVAGKKLTTALIENTGAINAEGGTVTLTASGAKDIVNTVINTSGIINVSSVTSVGGKIILEGANTEVSGTLDASGKTGGGTVLVGGDYQGKGATKTVNKTTVTKSAKIKANATGETGNGGKVIVWADDSTKFDGSIEAKGGYISGDGGFVETSGKINLGVSGDVDASAVNGLAGSWLLDPSNVIIVGTGGNAVTGGINNPLTDDYQVSASSIQTALNAGNNVTITTSRGAGMQEGNITTSGNVNINKTTGGDVTLTLQAHNNIQLDNTTISSTNNRLGINLTADSDNNGSGAITLGDVAFETRNGNIDFNKAVTLTADNIWNAGSGHITTGSTVDMGTYNLDIIAGNMTIGGNMTGVGSNVLTIKPDNASADIGVNGGYGFVLDLTEAGYLNPGSKLVLGYANGTGYGTFLDWDLSGKGFDLELNNANMWIQNFKQGDGAVKINGNQITLYNIELGSQDFFVDARKIGGTNGFIDMQQGMVKNAVGDSTLTLKSDGDIGVGDIISNGGALDVVLWTDADNSTDDGGFNHYNATITTKGGDIYLVGGLDDGANGNVAGDGIGDGYMGAGSILWGTHYDAGGGNILIKGVASSSAENGFTIGNNTILETMDAGAITVFGGTNFDKDGISINNSRISTEDGAITLYGYNPSTMSYGTGLITSGSTITSVNGDINLTGIRSGSTGGTSYGIELYSSNTEIISQNGNVYLTGTNTVTAGGVNAVGIHSWGDTKIASMTGDVVLTAAASATTGSALDWKTEYSGDFIVGDVAATGDIILNVNNLDFGNADTRIITQGSVTIKPRTASRSIGISGGAGDLNLSDSILNKFITGTLIIGDSINGTGDIDVDTWNISSLGYNVELYGNDIDLGGITLGTKDFLAYAKDNGGDLGSLTVSAAITKSAAGNSSLSLLADNNILSNANITTSNGALNILMNADRNANQDGAIRISSSTIDTRGGYFVAGGGSGSLGGADGILGNGDGTGADDAASHGNSSFVEGILVDTSIIKTGNGHLFMLGQNMIAGTYAGRGVYLKNSTLETSDGNIHLSGSSASEWGDGQGLRIDSSRVESLGTGNISLIGTSVAPNNDARGINIEANTTIKTVSGNIGITGTSTSTADESVLLFGNNSIESDSGNINITANGGVNGMHIYAGTNTIGGAGYTGDITLRADKIDFSNNMSVTTSGNLTIAPFTASTSIGLGNGAGDLNLSAVELGYLDAAKLIVGDNTNTGAVNINGWDISAAAYDVDIFGGDVDIDGMTLGTGNFSAVSLGDLTILSLGGNGGEINLEAVGDVSYISPDAITVDMVKGRSVLIQTTGLNKDITVRGQITADGAGNAATVAATGNFINNYGSHLFDLTGGGRWLIYSVDPLLNTRGGLVPSEDAIFGKTYGSLSPSMVSGGNRYIFSGAFVNDPGVMKPLSPVNNIKPVMPVRDFESYVVAIDKIKVMDRFVDIKQAKASNAAFMLQIQYSSVEGGTDMVYENEKVVIK